MFREAILASFTLTLAIGGCSAPRPVIEVTNPDPAGKIPAMKKAVREHDFKAVRQLIRDLDSDDPAVRMFAIHALHELTASEASSLIDLLKEVRSGARSMAELLPEAAA